MNDVVKFPGNNEVNFFEEECKILDTIFIITGLSLDNLRKEELYKKEVVLNGFPFDTLVDVLLKNYNYSESLLKICRYNEYDSFLDRLIALKEYLSKLESVCLKTTDKVDLVLLKQKK